MTVASKTLESAPEVCCVPVADAPLGEADAATLAHTYAALADPVRLRLLSLIAAAGEMCSCDLLAPLAYGQRVLARAAARSGRTTLLRSLARAAAGSDTARVVVLLVDEPRDVVEFPRDERLVEEPAQLDIGQADLRGDTLLLRFGGDAGEFVARPPG